MVDTINSTGGTTDPNAPQQGLNGFTSQPDDRFYGGFTQPGEVKINLASGLQSGADSNFQPTQSQPVAPVINPNDPLETLNSASTDLNYQTTDSTAQPTPQPPINEPVEFQSQPEPEVTAPKMAVPEPQRTTPLAGNIDSVAPQLPPTPYDNQGVVDVSNPINLRGLMVIVGIGLGIAILGAGIIYFVISSSNNNTIKKLEGELANLNNDQQALLKTPSPLVNPEPTPTPEPTTTPTPTPEASPTPTPTPIPTPVITAPSTNVSPSQGDGRLGTG